MADTLLTYAQVAERLAVTLSYLHRNRSRLTVHGFPPPLASLGRGCLRWDPLAVEAWIAAQRGDIPLGAGDGLTDMDRQRDLLRQRAKGLGARQEDTHD